MQLLTVPHEHRPVHELAEERLPEAILAAPAHLEQALRDEPGEARVDVEVAAEERAQERGIAAARRDRGRVEHAPLLRRRGLGAPEQEHRQGPRQLRHPADVGERSRVVALDDHARGHEPVRRFDEVCRAALGACRHLGDRLGRERALRQQRCR